MTEEAAGDIGDPAVAALVEAGAEAIGAICSGETTAAVAVRGDPFAGRDRVLDYVADGLGATRVELEPGDGVDVVREQWDGGALVVGGCQHLYSREIGGFEPLDEFLGFVPSIDGAVVTGWNRYAWAYLAAVRGIDRDFPLVVDVGGVPAETLAELLVGRYEKLPSFVEDDPGEEAAVPGRSYTVSVGDRSVSIPIPAFGEREGSGEAPDPRAVVFDRLAAVSEGNVGVAVELIDPHVGGEMRPSDVVAAGSDLTLDREEAFCVRLVLAKERIRRAELERIVDADLDRLLGRLVDAGVLAAEDGVVRLEPAALPTLSDKIEREQLL